ncbi:hypothetical protein D3C76_1158380 [compost metagenome]
MSQPFILHEAIQCQITRYAAAKPTLADHLLDSPGTQCLAQGQRSVRAGPRRPGQGRGIGGASRGPLAHSLQPAFNFMINLAGSDVSGRQGSEQRTTLGAVAQQTGIGANARHRGAT